MQFCPFQVYKGSIYRLNCCSVFFVFVCVNIVIARDHAVSIQVQLGTIFDKLCSETLWLFPVLVCYRNLL